MQEQDNSAETSPETTNTEVTPTPVTDTAEPSDYTAPLLTAVADKKPSKRKKLIGFGALALLLIAGGVTAYTQMHDSNNLQSSPQPIQPVKEQKQEVAPALDPILQKFIKPTTGETWLPVPKKLADQGYLKYSDPVYPAEYYEVGKRADKTIILSVYFEIGQHLQLYEKGADGKVTAITHPDGETTYNTDNDKYTADMLKPSVTIDTTTHYDSLTIPRKLDLDKGYTLSKSNYPSIGDFIHATDVDKDAKESTVRTVGQSVIVSTEHKYIDTKLTSIGYSVKLPINTKVSVSYDPLETDTAEFQWKSGNSSGAKIKPISRGCGGRTTSVTRSDTITDADVQESGKSPSGNTVYELKDPNSPLLQKAYQEFKEYAGADPSIPNSNISMADFIREHAVVIYKDKFSQWLVYVREDLAPASGCAKPVVYLYPTTTQQVSVKVGADVKISDPLYNPTTGWKALARPNGQLTVDGRQYGSLFWEGPGIGEYPSVTSGTVVKTQYAVATIRTQLAQQGLNRTEINDFVAYWQDKLPNKPYTRLTWFNTAQMDILAPLAISPKPDSVIRVFLDFSGLDQPISIPAQNLSSIPRNGFTVVEWGGLSLKKLY